MAAKTLLYNAGVITMDTARQQYNRGAVLIEGNMITAVEKADTLRAAATPDTEIINLHGKYILPGLINTHVHTSQQLARGLGDDVDLLTWLHERIWPYESGLALEDSYLSALLCGVEQIRSGVTCFAEAAGQHVDGIGKAVTELGVRAILARSSMDMGEGLPSEWEETAEQVLEAQVAMHERWHGRANERIRAWFSLRTIFNNSDKLILLTKELASRFKTGIHMHVAELKEEINFAQDTRGNSTVYHLEKLGILDQNFMAVHAVWLSDKEIQLIAKRGVKVSHNPGAAMRVLGFAKIPEMLKAGICVALGTDGAPCNNRMTLIDEMWLASLIHKGRTLDPTVVKAEEVLKMATNYGARALLWENEIGSIEAGKKADLIIIDPDTATMLPMHDPVANMVYAMRSDNISSVMVDGQWVMLDRKILTVNEEDILKEVKDRAVAIARKQNIRLPNRFKVVG